MKKWIIFLVVSVLTHTVWHALKIATEENLLLQWLPDDTFYYLALANHFVAQGLWTFDGGQTVTTGFHPLWAYLLVPLAYLSGDNKLLFMQQVAGVSFTLAIILPCGAAVHFFSKNNYLSLLLLTVFLSAMSFLANSVSGMEWSLTLIISAFYHLRLTSVPNAVKSIFLLGLLGSLARSEFGVFAFSYVFAALLIFWFTQRRDFIFPSLSGLSGAVIGLGILFLHNFYFSGEFLQSSSQIKIFWSEAFGHSGVPILLQFLRIIFYIPTLRLDVPTALKLMNYANPLLLIVMISLGVGIFIGFRKRFLTLIRIIQANPASAFPLLASILILNSYLLLYAFNAFASQIWYTALLTVPAFVVLHFILQCVTATHQLNTNIVMGGLVTIIATNLSLFHFSAPIYQGQELGKSIGLALKQVNAERIGISDAGIVSFYQGGTIINTDGLVNNEIKNYLYHGRLECYLLDKHIRYTSGFGSSELAVAEKFGPIEWNTFSKLKTFSYRDFQVAVREINFSQLAELPKCRIQSPFINVLKSLPLTAFNPEIFQGSKVYENFFSSYSRYHPHSGQK